MLEKADRDLVIDRGDPRSEPRCSFSFLLFGPRAHLALENRFASLHFNGDVFCVDLCGATQRILDLLLQVGGRGGRFHGNQVAYTRDAPESPYSAFSFILLVLPLHLTLECQPAFVHRHLNLVSRNIHIPLQRLYRGSRNVSICTLSNSTYLYIVGYGDNSGHTMGSLLGPPLLQVSVHCSCKSNDPVFDDHTDFIGLDALVPAQFGEHVCLNLLICTSRCCGCHRKLPF